MITSPHAHAAARTGRFPEVPALRLPLIAAAALTCLAAGLSACDDNPFLAEILLTRDTVLIAAPTAGADLPSAIDLVRQNRVNFTRRPETLQDAQVWDFALRDAGGSLVLRPYQPIGTTSGGAGIAPAAGDFEALDEAPRTESTYGTAPVTLSQGQVLYLRSRRFSSGLGACVKYARAKVVELDAAAGTARLAIVVNDNCTDERLVED